MNSVFFYKFVTSFFVTADASTPWQIGFQDPATPTIEGIIRFHHDLMFLLVIIVVFVG
jgi:hypothetical protein